MLQETRDRTGDLHHESTLWMSLRKDPIRREIFVFLWQALHGRTVYGSFIAKWGGEWAERAQCHCGALETLEHILVECQNGWRQDTWNEALKELKKAEATKDLSLSATSYTEILGIC